MGYFSTKLTLGEIVGDLIQKSGKTQKIIAQESGISETKLSQIKNGTRTQIQADTIRALCKYFRISADQLLGLDIADYSFLYDELAIVKDMTGLSLTSIANLRNTNNTSTLDAILTLGNKLQMHELNYVIRMAWQLQKEYESREEEIERAYIATVEGGGDEDYISAIQDDLDTQCKEVFLATVPLEEATDLYIEWAKTVFGKIITDVIKSKKPPQNSTGTATHTGT